MYITVPPNPDPIQVLPRINTIGEADTISPALVTPSITEVPQAALALMRAASCETTPGRCYRNADSFDSNQGSR